MSNAPLLRPLAVSVIAGFTFVSFALADVVVFSNRTPGVIPLRVTADGRTTTLRLESGVSAPVFADDSVHAVHPALPLGGRSLPLNEAYYFALTREGKVAFGQIGLEGPSVGSVPRGPWDGVAGDPDIPVLLVVDEEEPTREAVWSQRLRRRVAVVSKVLRAHAGVGLRVVGFERYQSDNRLTEFSAALRQFERAVTPLPGVVAIGFSSQFQVNRGRRRLGGTRGPLRRHLLVREYSPTITEAERIEVLAHEIGHYLAATHSPEADSVMRPVLGDPRTRLKSFVVKYDAVNTLAIAMVGEEARRRGVRSLDQLSVGTKLRLGKIYMTLAEALPDDGAADTLTARVVGPLVDRLKQRGAAAAGPAAITAAVTREAIANSERSGAAKFEGDELTNRLTRAAASVVRRGEDRRARAALLVALGFAFDDTNTMVRHPRTARLAEALDPEPGRTERRAAIGVPTARGRADTVKHFFVSAALTAASSATEADAWGLAKEAIDASGGSGYSFADLAANRAGIRFAERVLDGGLTAEWIAASFDVNDLAPELADLPEGLQAAEMVEQYGGVGDPRFEAIRARIDARIDGLPPYILQGLILPR